MPKEASAMMSKRLFLVISVIAAAGSSRIWAGPPNPESIPAIGDVKAALRWAHERAEQAPAPAAIHGEVSKERTLSVVPAMPENDTEEAAFITWAQGLPADRQNQLIGDFARVMGKLFNEKRFAEAMRFAYFLLRYDEHNGHGSYYLPEILRSDAYHNNEGKFDAAKKQSHEFFQAHLDFAENIPELTAAGAGTGIEECYSDQRGYCRQRAGWVCHRLALDYLNEGQASQNPIERLAFFVKTKDKAQCALKYYPDGFTQGKKTEDLIKEADASIAASP